MTTLALAPSRPCRLLATLLIVVCCLLPTAALLGLRSLPHGETELATPQQHVMPGQTPTALDAASWASIRQQVAAGPYRLYPAAQGYLSANPAQGFQIAYTADGTTRLSPRDLHTSPWAWSLRLASYGYATPQPLAKPPRLQAAGQRLTYHWSADLTEWWQNTADGLEQGFVLQHRPPGVLPDTPLQLRLTLSSTLRTEEHGSALAVVDASGATVLTYAGLRAWDAGGRALAAKLAVEADQMVLRVDDAAAHYPLTIDPVVQQAYLKASNPETNAHFGVAVVVSGDTVVVGADYESSSATGVGGNQADTNAQHSGAVYVFVRNGSTWAQQAYLKASNTGANDRFGSAVAIAGDTVVVGAPGEASSATGVNGDQADDSAQDAGAAYVFVRSGTTWAQQAYLKASNTKAYDRLGNAVAIAGDTIVVGANGEDSSATGVSGNQADNSAQQAGAAYVFVRNGSTWAQQAYLKASNTGANDFFGAAVAIAGDTIVVGANGEDSSATGVGGNQADNSAQNAGAAYIFVRNGTTWTQQAYLKASNSGANDTFGSTVAMAGDTIVVGAFGEASNATGVNGNQADNSTQNAGAAYIFVRNGTTWTQQAYLKASNTGANNRFGSAVAMAGDTIVVGAFGEASSATSIDGNQADNSAQYSGAAYVFVRNGSTWEQHAYLKASNTGANDIFGSAVAIAGDTIVVEASGEASSATGVNGNQADNSAQYSGAAYVFRLFSAPSITSGTPPPGRYGIAYHFNVIATGTQPITFSISSGALPPGLSLDAATGIIDGTPTSAGSFAFTLHASNGTLPDATQVVTITIASPLSRLPLVLIS